MALREYDITLVWEKKARVKPQQPSPAIDVGGGDLRRGLEHLASVCATDGDLSCRSLSACSVLIASRGVVGNL